jgi:hypothetical protein
VAGLLIEGDDDNQNAVTGKMLTVAQHLVANVTEAIDIDI